MPNLLDPNHNTHKLPLDQINVVALTQKLLYYMRLNLIDSYVVNTDETRGDKSILELANNPNIIWRHHITPGTLVPEGEDPTVYLATFDEAIDKTPQSFEECVLLL